ncbi:MAG: hypothetical protein AABM43_01100 [Actinomycetota bacterium]
MGNPTVHFEVAGKDKEPLNSFFTDLFNWKTSDVPGDMPYTMIEAEDGGIAGGIGASPDGYPGHVTFYVQVDDLEATSRRSSRWAAVA